MNDSLLLHTIVANALISTGTGVPPFKGDIGIAASRAIRTDGSLRTLGFSARIEDIGAVLLQEAFVGVAPRTQRRGEQARRSRPRACCGSTSTGPTSCRRLWAFLAERPCHLLIESGGSGGVHAYWKLAAPLPATRSTDDVTIEPIERANDGSSTRSASTPTGGRRRRPAVPERARVMRLAGTINHKTGAYARVLDADLRAARLPARGARRRPRPTPRQPRRRAAGPRLGRRRGPVQADRAARVLPAPRRDPRPARRARVLPGAPAPRHAPVLQRRRRARAGLVLSQRELRGARRDLRPGVGVLLGGPWGRELRGAAFTRARARAPRLRRCPDGRREPRRRACDAESLTWCACMTTIDARHRRPRRARVREPAAAARRRRWRWSRCWSARPHAGNGDAVDAADRRRARASLAPSDTRRRWTRARAATCPIVITGGDAMTIRPLRTAPRRDAATRWPG